MRHALVTAKLLDQARSASGPRVPERQLADAPPDPAPAAAPGAEPRPRRLATLFRRARALVARPT
jgi:hypothetical protein